MAASKGTIFRRSLVCASKTLQFCAATPTHISGRVDTKYIIASEGTNLFSFSRTPMCKHDQSGRGKFESSVASALLIQNPRCYSVFIYYKYMYSTTASVGALYLVGRRALCGFFKYMLASEKLQSYNQYMVLMLWLRRLSRNTSYGAKHLFYYQFDTAVSALTINGDAGQAKWFLVWERVS